MEIAHLSDAEFKTLVIRILKELIEYSNNIKEEMKVTINEINKNLQGTNSEGEEAGIQINGLEYRKKKTFNQKTKKKHIFRKNENTVRSIWDISKHTNIQIIGMPEGEEEDQEIENLYEKNNERKLP